MDVNILFMGSSDFSVPMINALFQSCGVKSVVTQPDKPAGRGKRIESPVVKRIAEELGIPVYQPNKLIREDILAILNKHRIDLIVVAAYGKILPAWLLDHPKYGAINVHASLLPKYRGASPIQAAILNGDQTTGVTIIKMDVGLDTGDILGWKKMKIEPNETAGSLSFKLAKQGAQLLVDTINDFILGRLTPKKQKSEDATFTRLIKKEDGELDLQLKAVDLERKIRAYNPWPVCYIKCESGPLRIFEAEISAEKLAPFQRGVLNRYPVIGTATTALLLKSVQPAGKKIMDGKSFLNGTKEWLGTR